MGTTGKDEREKGIEDHENEGEQEEDEEEEDP